MKILIILLNDKPGGAEQYLKMIARYYLEKGQTVNVYSLTSKNTFFWDDLFSFNSFKFITANSNKIRKGLFEFIKYIWVNRKNQYSYVYTSHVHTSSLLGIVKRLNILKTKHFIARESTTIFNRYKNFKLILFKIEYIIGYSSIDLLICQSQDMKNQLIYNLPWIEKKTKVTVLKNPIDFSKIYNSSKHFQSNDFKQFIVSAGRLIPEKGFDLLIKSFVPIKKKFPDLKLIILGEGKLRKELESLRDSFNLTDCILLPGFVKNVYPYFKRAEVCIVSSRIEGFPNVLLQMMSQNNNVVSTLCAGGIEDIEGLYTSKTNDIEGLTESIQLCLKNENIKSRDLFDKELSSRTIESFVSKIDHYLNEY